MCRAGTTNRHEWARMNFGASGEPRTAVRGCACSPSAGGGIAAAHPVTSVPGSPLGSQAKAISGWIAPSPPTPLPRSGGEGRIVRFLGVAVVVFCGLREANTPDWMRSRGGCRHEPGRGEDRVFFAAVESCRPLCCAPGSFPARLNRARIARSDCCEAVRRFLSIRRCNSHLTFALNETLAILQHWRALLLTAELDRYDSP
jgi:hypothetical protein